MSPRNRAAQVGLVTLFVVFLVLGYFSVAYYQTEHSGSKGNLTFRVPRKDPVAMFICPSVHYALDTEVGAEEYRHLLPPSGHLVHLPDKYDPTRAVPHTVAMFHQLKCMDLLREEYSRPEGQELLPFTRHCLAYLRQSILCRPNLRIESAFNTLGTGNRFHDIACHDWEAIYDAAAENYEQFSKWDSDY